MSGGYFDYNQYRIEDIASNIDELIAQNKFREETILKFKETSIALRRAAAMAQRVDWLMSGDDGEESFHRRWKEELSKFDLNT